MPVYNCHRETRISADVRNGIIDRRLKRAEQHLAYSHMSARDVGLACGFSSLAQFSRQYKMQFGFPPSQTRKVG